MTAEMPAIDSDGYQCAKRGVTPRVMAGRTVGVHRKRLIFFQIRTILIVHSSLFECLVPRPSLSPAPRSSLPVGICRYVPTAALPALLSLSVGDCNRVLYRSTEPDRGLPPKTRSVSAYDRRRTWQSKFQPPQPDAAPSPLPSYRLPACLTRPARPSG